MENHLENTLDPLFFSYPIKPLPGMRVSERLFSQISTCAQLGLKVEEIAYNIGMEPVDFRMLMEDNPRVRWAIDSSKAKGKYRMLATLHTLAGAGEVKAATFLAERIYDVRAPAEEQSGNIVVTIENAMPIPDLKEDTPGTVDGNSSPG